MKPFAYEKPSTLSQALKLLTSQGERARAIAGGTDLLVRMKEKSLSPEMLVDIQGLSELKALDLSQDGLHLGALCTHAEIASSSLVLDHAPVLAQASRSVGAVQTRNLGTLGGNLCTGVPSMDGAPALLVLEAKAHIASEGGVRSLPLSQFFRGPLLTALAPGELLQEIVIPLSCLQKPASFHKFGRRKALSLALVNAAASFRLDKTGRILEPLVALGAVAPTPMRSPNAEDYLAGKSPEDAQVLQKAGQLAAEEAKPIDDFRASAIYRRELIKVLVRRTLGDCAALAQERSLNCPTSN
ncbi:MAG: xanthine dehydrogenase family protein subunit M [Deltaproteobacteria bacterium]|nr:xanthine dehydrogenase family protein subunit M [Deltaproteobacteria bacterium]